MKKFILASFALIAVFASCKKEDIRTVYKAEPAKATITVEVYDAFLGQNVTTSPFLTGMHVISLPDLVRLVSTAGRSALAPIYSSRAWEYSGVPSGIIEVTA